MIFRAVVNKEADVSAGIPWLAWLAMPRIKKLWNIKLRTCGAGPMGLSAAMSKSKRDRRHESTRLIRARALRFWARISEGLKPCLVLHISKCQQPNTSQQRTLPVGGRPLLFQSRHRNRALQSQSQAFRQNWSKQAAELGIWPSM